MPELPEVETTRRGIAPHLTGRQVRKVLVRQRSLRWPVPANLGRRMSGCRIVAVERRAKYLLLRLEAASGPVGTVIIHLGMSGSLRVVAAGTAVEKHDHVDIELDSGQVLRYTDPRRFGCLLWQEPAGGAASRADSLLSGLGPEPLSEAFDGDLLFKLSRRRKAPVKTFVMDGKIVVGVGNIYANEALFAAGIRPDREAGGISRGRYQRLAEEIKRVLAHAIEQGGTTLRDFVGGDGKPGYFKQELQVYGRGAQACVNCQGALTEVRLGQRSTVFCRRCQT